ncbi:MAG: uncharacterized protein JWQ67_1822 [Marmoricola sp.]|jgi:hypothetical protein|nr:uncharacterized protein [Marmoricola sp.]MCW2828206.1 uncharacterized protein [Marmoricola sp.]
MAEIRQGRWTARLDGDFVVFLIGARLELRHPMRSFNDLGGLRGMQHMLRHLTEHPEKGLLGHRSAGSTSIQYWRSFEDLERFASNPDDPHRRVWRKYWKRVERSGRTGIWHETFLVRSGEYESIYGNMPASVSAGPPSSFRSPPKRRHEVG